MAGQADLLEGQTGLLHCSCNETVTISLVHATGRPGRFAGRADTLDNLHMALPTAKRPSNDTARATVTVSYNLGFSVA